MTNYIIILFSLFLISCEKADPKINVNFKFSGAFMLNEKIRIELNSLSPPDTISLIYHYQKTGTNPHISVVNGNYQLRIFAKSVEAESILDLNTDFEIIIYKNADDRIEIRKYNTSHDRIVIEDDNYELFINADEHQRFIPLALGSHPFWISQTALGYIDFSGKTISYISVDNQTIFNQVEIDERLRGKISEPYYIKSLNKIAASPNTEQRSIILLNPDGSLYQTIELHFNYYRHKYDPKSRTFIVIRAQPTELLIIDMNGEIKQRIFTANKESYPSSIAISTDTKQICINYFNRQSTTFQLIFFENNPDKGFPILETIDFGKQKINYLNYNNNSNYLYFLSDNYELTSFNLKTKQLKSLGVSAFGDYSIY
ncbi:MAG: hypothetical protein KDD94_04795 [Calditrichaeota bacterium]|nr:hypothetical protein [Calditrichota bacterium]